MRNICVLLLVLVLLPLAASAAPEPAGAPVRIVVTGLQSIGEGEFLEMLGLSSDKMPDAMAVRRAIRTAFLKGIFEDIAITVQEGDPQTIGIAVRERAYIRKIEITGERQLSDRKIRKLFLFKEDEQLRPDLMEQAAEDLKAALNSQGFPSAGVRITVKPAERSNLADIRLEVITGPPRVIASLSFTVKDPGSEDIRPGETGLNTGQSPGRAGRGADAFSSFKDLMKISINDIYNQDRVRLELRAMREELKKRGYIKPVVGPFSFADGNLDIQVSPGKKLELIFQGNTALSPKVLTQESLLPESEDINDEMVGEATDRMLARYHGEGYPYVQIAPVIRSGEREISLSFFIYEGERVKVSSISFSGTRLPQDSLRQVMTLKENGYYNPDLLGKDQDLLREFFGALGYLEAVVRKIEVKTSENKAAVDLTVLVEEGEKTGISAVTVIGVTPEAAEQLKKVLGLKEGDPYNEVDISDARFRILEYYTGRGFASVDVSVQRQIEGHKATVVFAVSEGKKLFLGRTVIVGNRQTRYRVIRRELLHKEGQEFNLALFAEERQRLYKLGLFNDVQIEALEPDGDRSDVLVRVKEGNAGSVEFGAGYAEYEKFRGFLEVSYRNLWGLNREGLMRAEVSSLEQRYLLQYNEPWAFGSQLPLRVYFQYNDKRDINASTKDTLYHLTRYTLTAGIERKLNPRIKSELYYEFSLVRTTDVAPDVVLSKEDMGTLAIGSIKPVIIYDTRDNPFEPEKGVLAGASLKVASYLFLSETNFAKLEVYGSRFQKLAKDVVLALSIRGGVAYHLGDTSELPLVERFFLGGRSTVRGFDQDTLGPKGSDGNPTGGNVFLMGNVELRTSVGMGIGIVPFFDMGNVWVNSKKAVLSDMRYTAGLGLRYKTPVGPLRVDYGMKLNREPGESRGALHFSVGHAF
ncbi:MAG: outer membrane protein assembly factor BamA [Thermodesulfovibrio sp.]|nr:outer membrane protein assembly factor BamA [Thermodesulfovibrio sp.]